MARDGETVAFVEVKTRRAGPQGPAEALSRGQCRRLRRAAEAWIHAHPGVGREFRFDLVAIRLPEGGDPRIEHRPDAWHGDRL